MDTNNVQKIVYASICAVKKDIPAKQLSYKASLIEDLDFDSLALVSLAAELEKRFQKSLPLSQWVNQNAGQKLKVGNLIQFLSDLK